MGRLTCAVEAEREATSIQANSQQLSKTQTRTAVLGTASSKSLKVTRPKGWELAVEQNPNATRHCSSASLLSLGCDLPKRQQHTRNIEAVFQPEKVVRWQVEESEVAWGWHAQNVRHLGRLEKGGGRAESQLDDLGGAVSGVFCWSSQRVSQDADYNSF